MTGSVSPLRAKHGGMMQPPYKIVWTHVIGEYTLTVKKYSANEYFFTTKSMGCLFVNQMITADSLDKAICKALMAFYQWRDQ